VEDMMLGNVMKERRKGKNGNGVGIRKDVPVCKKSNKRKPLMIGVLTNESIVVGTKKVKDRRDRKATNRGVGGEMTHNKRNGPHHMFYRVPFIKASKVDDKRKRV
jgi:hypothetical protein